MSNVEAVEKLIQAKFADMTNNIGRFKRPTIEYFKAGNGRVTPENSPS